MFDLPSARRAALDAQVPPPVLWTVIVVAVIAAILTGYGLAAGRHRHRLASSVLFVAVALTITLIVELDEPRSGLIRVPQTPFDRTADAILSAPVAAD
jgi:purine-cytosine permease-like protein